MTKKIAPIFGLVAGVLLILSLVICYPIVVPWVFARLGINFTEFSEFGTFGDSFGALNTLFSGMAFSLLIYTSWMQKTELELQRQVNMETKSQIEGQKKEMEVQSQAMKIQQFESTYFKLLDLHINHVRAITYHKSCGAEALQNIRADLDRKLGSVDRRAHDSLIDLYRNTFEAFLGSYERYLVAYLRNFSSALMFVDGANCYGSDNDKVFYIKLLREQLTEGELVLLFFYAFVDLDGSDLKRLFQKYEILSRIPDDVIRKYPEVHAAFV